LIKATIEDGYGDGHRVRVNSEGSIPVVVHPHPPNAESFQVLPFRQYLTDDGASTGSFDMVVDGATTNTQFFISAQDDRDIYIKTLSVVIADVNATLDEFGNIGELTNGMDFRWSTQNSGDIIINEALKTNFDFIRLSGGRPAFGAGATAFRAGNVSGASEGYIPFLDLALIFGLPWGLRLRSGTKDKLLFTVRDNLAGVDAFNIIGYGVQLLNE
jgi:hypothetical protein